VFDTLVESGEGGQDGKRWYMAPVSLLIHGIVIGTIIAIPILFPQMIEKEVKVTLVAPSAPPPPPPPPAASAPQQVAAPKVEVAKVDQGPVIDAPSSGPSEPVAAGGSGFGVIGGAVGGGEGSAGSAFMGNIAPEAKSELDIEPPRIITADMTKPEPKDKVNPVYPQLALKAGVEGTVILQIVIGPKGNVESAKVLTVVPPKARGIGLEEAAVQAILQWKFTPAIAGGKAVRVYYNAPIIFKLN